MIYIDKKILGSKYLLSFWKNSHESFLITLKQDLGGKLMLFVSLPEQSSPNRPSEHWQCPSVPQVPWPLHVVLGLQNAKTNEKKVNKSNSKSENKHVRGTTLSLASRLAMTKG